MDKEIIKAKINLLLKKEYITSNTWNNFTSELRYYLENENIDLFRKKEIKPHVFIWPEKSPQSIKQLEILKRKNDIFYKCIKETNDYGPEGIEMFDNVQLDRVSHTWYLNILVNELNMDLNNKDQIIFEFGGGTGQMSDVLKSLDFKGKHIIYDLPLMLVLQEYFINKKNINVNYLLDSEKNDLIFGSNMLPCNQNIWEKKIINNYQNLNFIATYSLTETDLETRNKFSDYLINFERIIIVYWDWVSEEFDNIDNKKYINDIVKKLEKTHDCSISENYGNGLILKCKRKQININCFIINLSRCSEKKEKMIKKLSEIPELKYEFFNAIDGQEIDKNYLDNNGFELLNGWNDPFHKRKITKGEIGCTLSHYFVYQKAKDLKNEITLILEDDAVFLDDFIVNINNIINDFKISDCDMCYLSRKKMNDNIHENYIENSNFLIEPSFSYWCLAYLVKKKFCEKVVNSNILKNIIPIDEILPIMGNLTPNPCIEFKKYFDTDITICSTDKNIIKPENNAFNESETEINSFIEEINYESDLKIITVATDNKEPLERFIKSCNNFGLNYEILGLNQEWKGGNMKLGKGGGMKLRLLKEYIRKLENKNQLLLFTDSYDVIFLSNEKEILIKYENFSKDIVFAGEKTCWPNEDLKIHFTDNSSYKYINSGGFIGKASEIYELINNNFQDDYDDQEFIHQRYLDFKEKIAIDTKCEIFQTSSENILDEISINHYENRIINKQFNSKPCHYHGNGGENIKVEFNNICNYLLRDWNPTYQYHGIKNFNYESSKIFLNILLKNNKKELFLNKIFNLNYDKNKIEINIFYEKSSKNSIENLKEKFLDYKNFNKISIENKSEQEIRDYSLELMELSECDYYLNIDDCIIIENLNLINDLLQYDKNIVCPLFTLKEKLWSNYWGNINSNGWYLQSFNYTDIIYGINKGCWNVPYINHIYLIKKNIIKDIKGFYSKNYQESRGCDMSFCENCRVSDIFMFLVNENENGYLDNNDDDNNDDDNNDINNINMLTITDYDKNPELYLKKYFHEDFVNKKYFINEHITDVIQFKLVNDLFCEELIELCEKYGKWSGATNEDGRIGYENVPTNDIHFTELNIHDMWEKIIKNHISPVVSDFWGHYLTKNLNIGFVVKYEHDKFYKLEPHHDSSAYTINIALNDEYEGGEVNFIKKGKIKNKKGYALIHPGRITHYHEGLPVTNGTKYITVSFVN